MISTKKLSDENKLRIFFERIAHIPKGFKYRTPKDILLPLDLLDALSGKAFNDVIKFTKRFSNKLHLLRVKPHNEDSEDSKEEKEDKKNITTLLTDIEHEYHVITNVPMVYTVDCYTQSRSIDLTTLLVQNESIFERFFIGSPTTQISNSIRVPLLIFHS